MRLQNGHAGRVLLAAGLGTFFISGVLAFQNCAAGFAPLAPASLSGSAADSGLNSGGPGGNVVEPVTGGAVPVSNIQVSYLYVGTSGKIASFKINRAADSVQRLTDVGFVSKTPGWLVYDPLQKRVLVSDAYGSTLSSLLFAPLTGLLSAESTNTIIDSVIHFSIYPSNAGYRMFAASYDKSEAASYDLGVSGNIPFAATLVTQKTFTAGSQTHSITSDRVRKLVFVSNMGENLVRMFTDTDGQLSEVGQSSVASPRTAIYDATYNHLYVSTQVASGNSQVLIFDVDQTNGVYSLAPVGSMPMGMVGADLKLDHVNRYVSASVRDPGKEGIWMFPIDTFGLFESKRPAHFIPIALTEARSLQVSADGRYYAISCNSAVNTKADTLIYKMDYNPDLTVKSDRMIDSELVGPDNVLANLWIDVVP